LTILTIFGEEHKLWRQFSYYCSKMKMHTVIKIGDVALEQPIECRTQRSLNAPQITCSESHSEMGRELFPLFHTWRFNSEIKRFSIYVKHVTFKLTAMSSCL
jgi:hypothetical protein